MSARELRPRSVVSRAWRSDDAVALAVLRRRRRRRRCGACGRGALVAASSKLKDHIDV